MPLRPLAALLRRSPCGFFSCSSSSYPVLNRSSAFPRGYFRYGDDCLIGGTPVVLAQGRQLVSACAISVPASSRWLEDGRHSPVESIGRSYVTCAWNDTSSDGERSFPGLSGLAARRSSREQLQQVRGLAGRKDRSSIFSKPRPPTRKQRKQYRRRMRALHHEKVGRHSAPGSRAGPRREFVEKEWAKLLEKGMGRDNLEKYHPEAAKLKDTYEFGDALLDDLMGNTGGHASAPTPMPQFLGHAYDRHYRKITRLMEAYHSQEEALSMEAGEAAGDKSPSMAPLPTDEQISLLLRSYRDHIGSTKSRPCGIAPLLQLVLTDLRIPSHVFGERTVTSIMTCAATPEEGRQMLKLMNDLGLPPSSYAYSILVDLHAKRGDFRGCVAVTEEMSAQHGLQPTLAAYTSLLAACYKVCSKGALPQSLKAEAGEVAWEKWKEMRIIGVEADAMAYGALLRVLAARGLAEKAVDTLDEMQQVMNVLPTTLCFTSALKAVSRSHENALRFSGGGSKKDKRREKVTVHHGTMTRQILLQAERAQVEQDDGFVAALIQCAGAAGDLATAKAIYLARRVRRDYQHWRPVGSDSHLRQLRGETPQKRNADFDERREGIIQRAIHSSFAAAPTVTEDGGQEEEDVSQGPITLVPENVEDDEDDKDNGENGNEEEKYLLQQQEGHERRRHQRALKAFQEREYGKDTRIYSALLYAYSQAMGHKGLGTMWEGRSNRGYLHEWSLRRLKEHIKPKYKDSSIPGVSGAEVGLSTLSWKEHDLPKGSKRLKLPKWEGLQQDDSFGQTLDDVAPLMHNVFAEHAFDREANDKKTATPREGLGQPALPSGMEADDDVNDDDDLHADGFFDDAAISRFSMDGKTGKITRLSGESSGGGGGLEDLFDDFQNNDDPDWTESNATTIVNPSETPTEEYYFDSDARQWKSRPIAVGNHSSHDNEEEEAAFDKIDIVGGEGQGDEMEQEHYFDSETRQWKTRMRKKTIPVVIPSVESSRHTKDEEEDAFSANVQEANDNWDDFDSFLQELKSELRQEGGTAMKVDEEEARELYEMMMAGGGELNFNNTGMETKALEESVQRQLPGEELVGAALQRQSPSPVAESQQTMTLELERSGTMSQDPSLEAWSRRFDNLAMNDEEDDDDEADLVAMDDLEEAELAALLDSPTDELALSLPGFPKSRLDKVRSLFLTTMGNPSMLNLVPALRENMPGTITMPWLRRKCLQDASFVAEKAEEDGLMDMHLLNGMLQVITKAGNTQGALAFHEVEYQQLGLTPTPYTDRLVLEMLLKTDNRKKRWERAMAFKEKVESQGRVLDLLSFSSLLEYCGNHEKTEEALLLLKECLQVHPSPPGEKGLQKIRSLIRKRGSKEAQVQLETMIGQDPVEWLRDGEANRRREYSYRGRRDVTAPANRLLQI